MHDSKAHKFYKSWSKGCLSWISQILNNGGNTGEGGEMIVGDIFPLFVQFKIFWEDSFIIVDGLMKKILLIVGSAFKINIVLLFIFPD